MFRIVLILTVLATPSMLAQEKIRAKPTAATRACGKFIDWRPSLSEAQAESKATGRPVFWYLATVPGSRMDRKPEVDLYMRAGPFSSPPIVRLLNRRFIPVRARPRRAECKEHGLEPLVFIEPGFVVLTPEGEVASKVDRVSTIHDHWFFFRLLRLAGPEAEASAVEAAAEAVSAQEQQAVEAARAALAADQASDAEGRLWPFRVRGSNEARFLYGAALWFGGKQAEARAFWASMAATTDMWTTRAGAEAQGYGPIARGLFSFRALPLSAFVAGEGAGTRKIREAEDRAFLIDESLRFLLVSQDRSGAWRDSIYDYGGTRSLPNVYMAGTALAGLAIHSALHGGAEPSPQLLTRLRSARDRALAYCIDESNIATQDRNEIVWAHLFRVLFLARSHSDLKGAQGEAARRKLGEIARELVRTQLDSGAWRHEYPNPFVTAAVIHALTEAREHGVAVPDDALARGVAILQKSRGEDGTFSYGMPRRGGGAAVPFSAGRMPACELGLLCGGSSSQADLAHAIKVSADEEHWLMRVRKYDDHADEYGNGGFFFWYDLFYRSEALDRLGDAKVWGQERERLEKRVYSLSEFDGTFIDSHELGKSYGTAMALLVLANRRD